MWTEWKLDDLKRHVQHKNRLEVAHLDQLMRIKSKQKAEEAINLDKVYNHWRNSCSCHWLGQRRIAGQSQWVGRDKVYGDSHGSLTDVKRVSGFRPVRISAGSQSSPGVPLLPAP
ncbi:hypothetical protein EYF80_037332 [Liparis tanakae]|uniref:Uncharacterized protein n=1 Tax=Liparis tanakae TaxID=230148 RepID=A0A4Z2GHU1_9TELE|nr:hypothetical protein EYF80_037332 [Liparis tanakae]